MSAGICIMNRNAIAMAADSAVTIGDHIAIHNSANKLFSLSKVSPVGAIIYANSDFLGVPIEIIIKEYKKYIGTKSYSTLEEYFNVFISYLESNIHLYRLDLNEEIYVTNVFASLISILLANYTDLYNDKVKEKSESLSNKDKINIAIKALNATKQYIDSQKTNTDISFVEYIKQKYKPLFNQILKKEEKFNWLTDELVEDLSNYACNIFDKQYDRSAYVGLAIAGYGDNEIYPSLIHVHLYGYLNGKIRYSIIERISITEQSPSSVIPLAQVDVMQTFLFGINDHFLRYLANEIPSQIEDSVNKMNDSFFASGGKNSILEQMKSVTGNILQHMQTTAFKNYLSPILESVATLPIEELGLLAESLINITSIRRKVVFDRNIGTVGGPIDVSIVSKGDGFIWLKRKHYFDRKFNPQYFYSHYMPNNKGNGNDDE